ncbi:MAG: uracil-DNA glycosylase [Armatimonadota bacterium]
MAERRNDDDELYKGFAKPPLPDVQAEAGRKLSPAEELEVLAQGIRVCRNCDLSLNRTNAVPGEGNPQATIMFVGEAPGATEDKTGRPFVGTSGKFLDAMLADIGLQRSEVFIANVNRCRPPENRDPTTFEVEACDPWLRAQIRVIQPKVVCPLGRFALETLVDPKLKISKVHGQPFEKAGILFIPLYHPAAALHRQDLRETLKADMHRMKEILVERGLWE